MRRTVLACLFTLLVLSMNGRTIVSQNRLPEFDSLKLKVVPEKTSILLGEPLVLKVKLANPTLSSIATHRTIDPGYGTIQVYFSRPGGELRRYLGPSWGTGEQAPAVTQLAPSESVYGELTVLFNTTIPGRDDLHGEPTPINEPGTYQVVVEFYDVRFQHKIVAPRFEVQVSSPTGKAEQAYWQEVQADPNLAYFLQTGSLRRGQNVVKKVEQLMSEHPGAVHQKHAALALGKYYLKNVDPIRAIDYLKEAAESAPKSYLRAQALVALAKSYAQLGQFDEALRISDAAVEEFTLTGAQQNFIQLGTKLRKALSSN